MQSSLWKLLTAAGIVGIGTLIVLEVQNRLPVRNSSTSAVGFQTAGSELTVTPDASTAFDEAMVNADAPPDANDPAQFDRPGLGIGKPAPPADDSKFFGTVEERTVRKDDLTDGDSPFSSSLSEPAEESEFFGPVAGNTNGSAPPESAKETRDVAAKSASFQGDTASLSEPVASVSEPLIAEADPVIPFPAETPEKVVAPQPVTSAAPKEKAVEKTTMMFFPNGSGTAANSSIKRSEPSQPAAAASQKTITAAPVTLSAALAKPSPSAAVAPVVAKDKPLQAIQRVSATDEEPPMMFVPEPVPDLGRPSPETSADFDEALPSDPPSFENDSAPTPSETGTRPRSRRPASTETPDPEEPAEQFFGEDSSGTTSPELPPAVKPDDDAETLPFMPDDPDLSDEPARPLPIETEPLREPLPEPFPEPRFPNRSPSSNDRPDDDGSPLPFEPDNSFPDPANGEPLPLPSADDLPERPNRPDRSPPGRETSGDSKTRTVSEVMRPQLTIQKRAPNTATVGVSHDYTIVVTNEGASAAYDVVVEDELGGAADFLESKPVAEYNRSADQLVWNFRELRPGDKKEITVRIKPTGEGTLDGVATVRFKAQVKSATVITAPRLELQLSGPNEAKVGDEVQLTYTIRNRGSGDAANVILRSVLPPGLKHPEGGDLEYEIENLRAGEDEEIDLTVIAAEPGELILVSAEVTSSGVSAAKARTEIEVVGAQLTLERLGPERRYVGRPATYQNIVTNDSKFEATNAVVMEELPEGMRFVSASNGGEYNRDNRRIRWTIPRLGAGKQAILEVELVAEEAGQMETIVEVTENAGFRTPLTENTIVTVEDLHNVTADISRQDEPVAIGARFGFTVTIDNRGTAVARNVEMTVQVPPELKILAAGTRDVPGKLFPGNVIKYSKVLEIQPNDQMTFQLTLQGEKPVKNAPVRAYLKYDEMQEALIVSESVTVFDDRP